MSQNRLWRTITNLIAEKSILIGVGGRLIQKNPNGTSAANDFSYESLTTTRQVRAEESGKTFLLNSATAFVTTLPLPALGLKFTFIVQTAPVGANDTIVTANSANIIKGMAVNTEAAGVGSSSATADTISFVNAVTVASDMVEVRSDGTSWFAQGASKLAAGLTYTTAS